MLRDLGNAIDTFLTVAPQTIGSGATAATVNGYSADRIATESAVFVFTNCQPYGSPLGVTVTCKVQESSDDSTFTDVTDASSAHNITNTYTSTEINVDLSGVMRYVRGYMSVQFNGGTGPYAIIAAGGILGSAREYPL